MSFFTFRMSITSPLAATWRIAAVERELVARDAEAGDRAERDVREVGVVPESLAGRDVRQVQLDERHLRARAARRAARRSCA